MKSELKRIEEDIAQGFEHEWVEETAENRYLKVLDEKQKAMKELCLGTP